MGVLNTSVRDLAIALARDPDVVAFARGLVASARPRDRLARIAAVFTFVGHLVDVPEEPGGEARDGVDLLLGLAGDGEGAAVILAALLQALGERAAVDAAGGLAFVRVEIDPDDLARVPPHARPFVSRGRFYLPLDARDARRPLGFLPWTVRLAVRRA
jgi:hypothetical protein